ncbi:MAG TPA: methyltransferase domain-containing protein [Chryseolinea sp.]|nr:methyltransferase domain-containing protein [Chryseolinea sp.]
MKNIALFILMLISLSVSGQDPWKNIYRESAWAERDTWQRADEIIKLLKIKSGSNVADVGCHEGYMTVKLSREVNENGKVYAVDVDQSKLDLLKKHLSERKIENVNLIKGDYDNPKLPANSLDAAIILDTYHEMDDHDKILEHLKTSLKYGGRLILCEPIGEARKKLTRAEQERKHELGMNFALEDLKKAGFEIIVQKDPFVDRSKVKGDMMWIIVAQKK